MFLLRVRNRTLHTIVQACVSCGKWLLTLKIRTWLKSGKNVQYMYTVDKLYGFACLTWKKSTFYEKNFWTPGQMWWDTFRTLLGQPVRVMREDQLSKQGPFSVRRLTDDQLLGLRITTISLIYVVYSSHVKYLKIL